MNGPTRNVRRRLDRRARKVLSSLEWKPLPDGVDVERDVGLLREGEALLISSRQSARLAFVALGLFGHLDTLDALEAAGPKPGRLAIMVELDGAWLSVEWRKVLVMANGGAA